MLQIKQIQNKGGSTARVVEKPAKAGTATTSIITYSPSKFIARASSSTSSSSSSSGSGNTYTKKQIITHTPQTQTHTTTSSRPVSASGLGTNKVPAKTTTASYYVVKAGSLGSAATVSAAAAVAATSSPPKLQLQSSTASSAASTPVATVISATITPINSSSTISAISESNQAEKMEHSYMRDANRMEMSNGLAPARTILVSHPPQCPSCHTYPVHEKEPVESQQSHVPPYDEISAKEMMNECGRIAKYVRNMNSDEHDWEERVSQHNWTPAQKSLYDTVVKILDQDQLARLANEKRQHEAIHRRVTVDKSSSRMRRALASVAWDPRTTQWLHMLLMDHLSPSYMASYLDIMQTLKTKLPTLTDKMLFSRPINNSQELLAPVMKKRWEPIIMTNPRQLTHNAIIVLVPTMPANQQIPTHLQKWYQALSEITQIVHVNLPNTNDRIGRQNLDQVAETIVSLTRVRIHELRTEDPNRGVILIGFNAGAALALQVAMSESIACVVCMGFAYNTLRGPRGTPDDRLLDIKTPILFVVGQNSARTSQEEMESLRERMQSESSLLIVGSADDALRVPKSKCRIEGVTQSMVDAMVVDEVYDFLNKTLSNPPGPRIPNSLMNSSYKQKNPLTDSNVNKAGGQGRKRKGEAVPTSEDTNMPAKSRYVPHKVRVPRPKEPRLIDPFAVKRKVGRPRTRPLPNVAVATGSNNKSFLPLTTEEVNMSIETMMNETLELNESLPTSTSSNTNTTVIATPTLAKANNTMLQNPATTLPSGCSITPQGSIALSAGTKIKMITSSQIVQLKSMPSQGKIINYTINKTPGSGLTATSTGASIGSIVKALPTPTGQQIFTLKTPTGQTTQFVTAAAPAAQQKYTVIKNANGTTMLQLTKNVPTAAAAAAANAGANHMDLSNIIDMPIVFADNEGNIAAEQQRAEQRETPKFASTGNKSNVGQLIISQKIIKDAGSALPALPAGLMSKSTVPAGAGKGNTILLNRNLQQLYTTPGSVATNTTTGKVIYLNRSAIKPMTNVVSGARLLAGATALPIRVVNTPRSVSGTLESNSSAIVTNMQTLNLQSLKSSSGTPTTTAAGILRHTGTVSLGNKSYPQFQMVNNTASVPSQATSFVSADSKQQVRNIYLKSAAGIKQLPVEMMANRQGATAAGTPLRRVLNINAMPKSSMQADAQGKIIKLQTPNAAATTKGPE